MPVLASRAKFEPATEAEREGAWYTDGYHEYPFFAARIADLKGRYAPNGQKTLVVGAGWGYLVQLGREAGYDAWGCDASSYAVSRDVTGGFMLQADALSDASIRTVLTAMGVTGANPRCDLLVTEDLLSCLSDPEITQALTVLRARCRTNLLHLVTCLRPDWWPPELTEAERRARDLAIRDSALTWKTLAEWEAILTPPDLVLDTQAL
jgi:hypothetical protein